MGRAVVIAVLIVLVLVAIYAAVKGPRWARPDYWLANFIESPWKVYMRSGGTFDAAAELALRRAAGRANPTPLDHRLS